MEIKRGEEGQREGKVDGPGLKEKGWGGREEEGARVQVLHYFFFFFLILHVVQFGCTGVHQV